MRCSECNKDFDCSCSLENGLCITCRSKNKTNISSDLNNYCEQTLDNLHSILNRLKAKNEPNDKLIEYQIIIVNSQIKMFDKSPCTFKLFIDNIQW